MKARSKIGSWPSRPDLVYAGVVAMIICVGLVARGIGLLPLQ
ncbi:MAG: hypothetical protein WDN46_06460 [Methylocella sp.]